MSAGVCDKRVSARVKEKVYRPMVGAAMLLGLKTETVGVKTGDSRD